MSIKAYPVQALGITAAQERMDRGAGNGVGIIDLGALKVTVGSSLNSNVAAGRANIRNNQAGSDAGIYRFWSDATEVVTHTAGDGTNPRIDSIYAKVIDAATMGGGTNAGSVVIVAGTPTGGATLDNRTGAGVAPTNSILLSDVLVPAGAAASSSFTYRDRRPYGMRSVAPPIKSTPFDTIPFVQIGGMVQGPATTISTAHNNYQMACAIHLPTQITATKIRWSYTHTGTALTGNYVLAIFDASGRLIVATSSTAFTGAASSFQARSETIASTKFEPGIYYGFIGLASLAGGSINFQGLVFGSATTNLATPNLGFFVTSGGISVPSTILGLNDAAAGIGSSATWGIPLMALTTV